MRAYQPSFQLIHRRIALMAANRDTLVPALRRSNRIRTLQALLAIEQNTLSVEQVTAVLERSVGRNGGRNVGRNAAAESRLRYVDPNKGGHWEVL